MAKPKPKSDPLSEIRSRIRDAEKKQAPVIREAIGMSSESFETVAELVERGLGKKPDVLRQALATGLRVLKAGSDSAPPLPIDANQYPDALGWLNAEPEAPEDTQPGLPGLVAGTVGVSLPITAPMDTPPSQAREDDEAIGDE